jgi:hypothetical protein
MYQYRYLRSQSRKDSKEPHHLGKARAAAWYGTGSESNAAIQN